MLAGQMLMELWMEEEENKRKAEEFKMRRQAAVWCCFRLLVGGDEPGRHRDV